MIETTAHRKKQAQERAAHRSQAKTLENIIATGTSCSKFEAGVIVEKAQEVFHIGPYGFEHQAQPGQMVWRAIDAAEPPGKPLQSCIFKDIRLSVHRLDEDAEGREVGGMSGKRQSQIVRMTQEALDQGTLLTQQDLAILLDSDERTIRSDIQKIQKRNDILIPTRGNKLDIGPGITHRDKALEKYIRGQDAVAIARDLNHSLKAVERYISSFCRILYSMTQLQNTLKTAMVVGVSVGLVNRCLGLRDRFKSTPEYRTRLAEIEERGSIFWECQDAKKKRGRKSGRPS